jgi:hypothetical protein
MRARLAPSTLLLLAAACGGSSGPSAPHIDFSSDAYTLQPGQEKYYCYAMNLPSTMQLGLTRIVPTYGQGTHHILMSQTLVPEPAGFSECPVLAKQSWIPIYAGGKSSGPLTMPDGVALQVLTKGQQIVLQLHLQNTTTAPITDKTSMRIEYVDASLVKSPAGIFGLDNRVIHLPPHTDMTTSMTCDMPKEGDVFAVLGHMHKLGRHIRISTGANPGDTVLYENDWNFDLQPITPKSFHISKGEKIFLDCEHNNTTDNPVNYGESSDTEMCATVFYYSPYDGIDGCVNE